MTARNPADTADPGRGNPGVDAEPSRLDGSSAATPDAVSSSTTGGRRSSTWVSIAAAVALFVTTVVAANVLTTRYGLIPVGFGMAATAGTGAAGLTLLARDWVHHRAGRVAVLACITAGAVISAGLAGPRLAAASAVAFTVSELADLLVYQRLLARRRGWVIAAAVSNAVGAPVDTVLFLAIAGLPIIAAVPGQLWVKTLATILPLNLVSLARALLRHRLRPPRP